MTSRSTPSLAEQRVSVAIPIFNEEEVLPELLRRLLAVLDTLPGGPHEILFVDDGSSDRSVELLRAAAHDPRIVVLELSRNFGHQAAITAALDRAEGDAVVVMDGDLQDPPEAIPALLAAFQEGHDVVYVRRVDRKESLWLRAAYFMFSRLIDGLSDLRLPFDSGDFALLSRRVVTELRAMPEHHRYLRGLRTWVGFRQIGIDVERAERFAGTSKYPLLKLLRLAFDGIFAFSVVPLRTASWIGFLAIFMGSSYALYAIYAKLFLDQSPPGFTALAVAIVFLAGVQLLFIGVVGEYVSRIYEEVKRRPHYVIKKATVAGKLDEPSRDQGRPSS